jgi:hypothetical protein
MLTLIRMQVLVIRRSGSSSSFPATSSYNHVHRRYNDKSFQTISLTRNKLRFAIIQTIEPVFPLTFTNPVHPDFLQMPHLRRSELHNAKRFTFTQIYSSSNMSPIPPNSYSSSSSSALSSTCSTSSIPLSSANGFGSATGREGAPAAATD